MGNMMEDNIKKIDLIYKKGTFIYIAYVGLLLAFLIVLLGIFQILFGTVRNEDGVILTFQDQLPFFIPFMIVGITWVLSFVQLTIKIFTSKIVFRISDDGFHDVVTGGIFLAFVFLMRIKFVPFEHIAYDDSGLMPQFKIKKEFIKEYPLYTRLILRLKGIKLTLLYAKLDDSFAKFLKDKYMDPHVSVDPDNQ
jgi:hypothetical protein